MKWKLLGVLVFGLVGLTAAQPSADPVMVSLPNGAEILKRESLRPFLDKPDSLEIHSTNFSSSVYPESLKGAFP